MCDIIAYTLRVKCSCEKNEDQLLSDTIRSIETDADLKPRRRQYLAVINSNKILDF